MTHYREGDRVMVCDYHWSQPRLGTVERDQGYEQTETDGDC
jgi:hypothetical protein